MISIPVRIKSDIAEMSYVVLIFSQRDGVTLKLFGLGKYYAVFKVSGRMLLFSLHREYRFRRVRNYSGKVSGT